MGIWDTTLQPPRFTARVQRVLHYARQETARRDTGAVGTLHLLVGIVREGHGLLARVFAKWHVSYSALGEQLGMSGGTDAAELCNEGLAPDAETEKVLRFAAEEAERLGRSQITNEHLLVGILRADDSAAGKLLAARGMRVDAVRAQIAAFTSGPLDSPSSEV